MYRKAFLASFFIALASVLIFVFFKAEEKPSRIPDEGETTRQISHFNSVNSAIESISCKASAFGNKTEILYVKPSEAMVTISLFGRKQAEIATDGKEYWFWMRDFDKDSLYHCPLSRVSSTRVALPMRPNLFTSVLGVDEIRWESMSMHEGVAFLTLSEDDLVKCVLFEDGKMTGVVYRRGGMPVMTATFKSHQSIDGFNIPKDVNVVWHEQNQSVDFRIEDVVINAKDPPKIRMPDGIKRISLIDF